MRVPIPIVLLLSLAVMAGVWWYGSRGRDFLTPPPESRLAEIRSTATTDPGQHNVADEMSIAPPGTHQPLVPLPEPAPKATVDTGDTSRPPTLAEYRLHARGNPALLPELADALEAKGEIQRALLTHERILDSTKPEPDQLAASVRAVRRLRAMLPDWQTDPAAAVPVTLQIGAAKTTADALAPVVNELAAEMTRASSGLLAVDVKIHAGRDNGPDTLPPPVALWLGGREEAAASTAVISFTAGDHDKPLDDVSAALLELLRGQVAPAASLNIPQAVLRNESPTEMLHTHVSRLLWRELGTMLNPPAPSAE